MKRKIEQKISFQSCPDQGSQRCVLQQSPGRVFSDAIAQEAQNQEFDPKTKNPEESASSYCNYEQYIDRKGEPKFPMCQFIKCRIPLGYELLH